MKRRPKPERVYAEITRDDGVKVQIRNSTVANTLLGLKQRAAAYESSGQQMSNDLSRSRERVSQLERSRWVRLGMAVGLVPRAGKEAA